MRYLATLATLAMLALLPATSAYSYSGRGGAQDWRDASVARLLDREGVRAGCFVVAVRDPGALLGAPGVGIEAVAVDGIVAVPRWLAVAALDPGAAMSPGGTPRRYLRQLVRSVTNATHRKGIVRYASLMKRVKSTSQPKVRSRVAREAWDQTGAGSHGGTRRAQRRKDRQNTRRALRAGTEER